MSDFFGKLKSGAGKVAFDADKMNRVNKAKGEINKFKQQIDALYSKLGEITYRQFVNPGEAAPDISEICQNITDLGRQIEAKNADIVRINAEVYAQPGGPAPVPPMSQPAAPVQAAPAPVMSAPAQPPAPINTAPAAPAASTKFCPNCGKEMAMAVKFCPDCGTKMP